jgi:hypothetical protein
MRAADAMRLLTLASFEPYAELGTDPSLNVAVVHKDRDGGIARLVSFPIFLSPVSKDIAEASVSDGFINTTLEEYRPGRLDNNVVWRS